MGKLEAFKNAVNTSADNSHLVNVPNGPNIVLLGYLLNTPIMLDSNSGYSSVPSTGAPASSGAPGSFSQQDTEMDMVIRMSIEVERKRIEEQEEKKRVEAAAKAAAEKKASGAASGEASAAVQNNESGNNDNDDDDEDDDDEEAMARAIAMSMAGQSNDTNMNEKDEGKKEENATETKENPDDGDEGDRNEILCDRDFLADI